MMKGALIASAIGVLLLLFLFLKIDIYKGVDSIDIYLHDTYYVFSYYYFLLFLVLILATFFSIGGLVGSRFKSKIFWSLFLIFTLTDLYFFIF